MANMLQDLIKQMLEQTSKDEEYNSEEEDAAELDASIALKMQTLLENLGRKAYIDRAKTKRPEVEAHLFFIYPTILT